MAEMWELRLARFGSLPTVGSAQFDQRGATAATSAARTPLRRCTHGEVATMNPLRALRIVFALSLLGTAFSGTLSYLELFGASAMSCPAPGAPGTILGYPACVYGFFMFLVLAIISGAGVRAARRMA